MNTKRHRLGAIIYPKRAWLRLTPIASFRALLSLILVNLTYEKLCRLIKINQLSRGMRKDTHMVGSLALEKKKCGAV